MIPPGGRVSEGRILPSAKAAIPVRYGRRGLLVASGGPSLFGSADQPRRSRLVPAR